jgi:hypothetical protein
VKLRLLLVIGLLVSTGAAFALGAFVLKWTPKRGDKIVYKMKLEIQQEGEQDIVLRGTVIEETIAVDSTKVVTKTSGTLGTDDLSDEMEFEGIFKPDTTTAQPDGAILQVREEGEEPKGMPFRRARQTTLVFPSAPVSVGDAWTFEEPKDEETDVPGVNLTYTLVGEEKVGVWDTVKITMKGGETGQGIARSEATFWIEKATGIRVRTQSKITTEGASSGGDSVVIRSDLVRQP